MKQENVLSATRMKRQIYMKIFVMTRCVVRYGGGG
jgi:hypothetical protein